MGQVLHGGKKEDGSVPNGPLSTKTLNAGCVLVCGRDAPIAKFEGYALKREKKDS